MDADRTDPNDLLDGGEHLGGMIVGILDHRPVTGGLSDGKIGWIPESHASGFDCCQCGYGSLGNHPGFRFTHGRHYMKCQAIGGWHVAGHELDTGIHEIGDEAYRSCQSVEFGDHQGGFEFTSKGQGFSESLPLRVPARFDLDELAGKVMVPALEEG